MPIATRFLVSTLVHILRHGLEGGAVSRMGITVVFLVFAQVPNDSGQDDSLNFSGHAWFRSKLVREGKLDVIQA